MVREQAAPSVEGPDHRRAGSKRAGSMRDMGEIRLRIAAILGEIDALRHERYAEAIFTARAKLATAYFTKRQEPAPAELKAA